jgi:serine/threonine-protein phosphatase PGAM5
VTRARFTFVAAALVALTLAPIACAVEAPAGKGVHYVYLVRHGAYDSDSTVDEITGNGLNALGHQQARLLAARLAVLPVHPTSLVASTYRRAWETADDIGAVLKLPVTRDSVLHECAISSDREDFMRKHPADEVALCDSNFAIAWRRYMTPTPAADRFDVLVCHGNVIRAFVSRAVSGDPRHWLQMDIGNASLTVLAVRPDGTPRLVMFSDVGHLPLDRQSWIGKGPGWKPDRTP